jgi:hypothetical protein
MKLENLGNGNWKITSEDRQSNSAYHRSGKKTWWLRVELAGVKNSAEFIKVPHTRGDSHLEAVVSIPRHATLKTCIYIGVGPNDRDGVRESTSLMSQENYEKKIAAQA